MNVNTCGSACFFCADHCKQAPPALSLYRMKRFASVIVLLLYFAFSSGVVVNLHYCMNRFDSFQLGSTESEVCGKCGMHTQDSDGCCHDEIKIMKIDDDQQPSFVVYSFEQSANYLSELVEIDSYGIVKMSVPVANSHSPPISGYDMCVRNSVFRI